MKKSEAKGMGTLIVFAIIASPFIWLYKQIGGVGIVIIVVVGLGLYALSKSGKNKTSLSESTNRNITNDSKSDRQSRNEDVYEKDEDHGENELAGFTITVKTSGSSYSGRNRSSNNEPGRWIHPGEIVKVGEYTISKGLIYVGGVLKGLDEYSTESSLIDPTLPIDSTRPDYSGEEMGYWPKYLDISASSRAAYLEWLSGNRNDPDENIGYVFLYFYGLERRLLVDRAKGEVDNNEFKSLFNEIKRLLKIYGNNRSFKNYAFNLISHLWIINGAKGNVSDELLIFNNSYSQVFQYLLAQTVNDGKSIPPKLAYAWVKGNPDFRLRTPARRCSEEFRKLFEKRYLEAFEPSGLLIKPNKTKLSISYTPASSSLRGYEPIKYDLPDPTKLTSQAKKLCELAEECTNDLDQYSRFLGRKENDRESLSGILQLPTDLIVSLQHPKITNFKNFLREKSVDKYTPISVNSLLEVLGEEQLYKLNKKECETIAFLFDCVGFGLAPDIRYHKAKLELNGFVVIFEGGHGSTFTPSANYQATGTILRLGAMVAKIDGEVSDSEVSYLTQFIDTDGNLADIEKASLHAYLHWRLVEAVNAKGLKDQIGSLKSQEKSAISNVLINVAYADGYVDPSEVKQLEKLYVSLGLEKDSVAKDIHTISAQKDLFKKDVIEKSTGIDEKVASATFIDMELLRRHEAETEGVKNILSEIFAEPESGQELAPITVGAVSNRDIFDGLDSAHKTLYQKLIEKEEWAREELHSLCESISLMIDGSIETINDWAFEHVDAPLIEEGEVIYVDLDLAEEIASLRS